MLSENTLSWKQSRHQYQLKCFSFETITKVANYIKHAQKMTNLMLIGIVFNRYYLFFFFVDKKIYVTK